MKDVWFPFTCSICNNKTELYKGDFYGYFLLYCTKCSAMTLHYNKSKSYNDFNIPKIKIALMK